MKSAMACAAMVLLSMASGFAADEKTNTAANASLVAKSATPADGTQPVLNNAPAPVLPAVTATTLLPEPPSAIITLRKKQQPEAHRFFDARNSFALSSVAVSLTADALSTQKGLAYPGFYEINPVARPFVQSRTGAAIYSAGSLGLVAGGMYIAHRTHHHKLERILPFAIAGWESILSARNYHVISTRAK